MTCGNRIKRVNSTLGAHYTDPTLRHGIGIGIGIGIVGIPFNTVQVKARPATSLIKLAQAL